LRLEPLLSGGYAEVVWVREHGDGGPGETAADIGLKFVGLTHADRESISALVSNLERAERSRGDSGYD
jgi:hypothetical protein